MTHRKLDSVQQIATGTGTGTLTLGAATAANYRTMQAAGMTNADTGTFRIQHESIPAEWEEVLVTYSAGAITRTFDTNARSATGSLINFSTGNKIVSCVLRAGDAVVMDNNGDLAVTRDVAIGRNAAVVGAATVGGTLGVTGATALAGTLSVASNISLPIGNARTVGETATSTHAAGNVGSMFFGISDGGGFTGVKVNNTHNGTYSSQDVEFYTAEGGAVASTLRAKILKGGGFYGYSSISALGADAAFGAGGNRAMMDMAGGVARVGGIDGGGAATQLALYAGNTEITRATTTSVTLRPGGVDMVSCINGYLYSNTDNYMNLGSGVNRWNTVYATTGTINTSGRDAKLFVSEAIEAEKRAAATIKAKPRRYKLKDSVDRKGQARARWHFGYVAEDVRDALEAEGLDPWAYAFLCSDPLIKRETYFETAMRPKMRTVAITDATVEIIDGTPVMVRKEIERDEPVGELVAVVNEVGQHVMQQIGADEETGEPILAPMLHFVPEMEDYEVERTREVDTGEVRLGLRYSELEAFLRSAD